MYTTLVDLDIERKKLEMYWPMRTLNTSRKENKRISYPALHVHVSAILTVWELTCSAMNQRVREVRCLDRDGHSTPHLHAAAATGSVELRSSYLYSTPSGPTHAPSRLSGLYRRQSAKSCKKIQTA